MSRSENITNGSDTGNVRPGSWSAIMDEANQNSEAEALSVKLSLNEIICMPTHVAVETVIGMGRNPFLKASEQGKLRGPDGDRFEINIPEACYKWVNVRCLPSSPAQQWGVTKAEGLTEYEFMRESMNAAAQMGAQGSGLVLLIVSVISGILHDKFREVFIRALTDDNTWQAVTCWTKWVGTDPSNFTDAEKKLAVKDAKPWNTVWLKFAKDLVAELYPSENGATVDVSKALVKYGNFAKRKKVLNLSLIHI
jgi:hypothetical protein